MALEIAALLTLLAPFGTTVVARAIRRNASLQVARGFFRGKRCAVCDAPIREPGASDHAPALRRADGTTVEWCQYSTGELLRACATDEPICWNCHVAEEFRRKYPEPVTDRPVR